ncbi:MAG: sensor histidine kinase [Oligoflexales bacterium]
MTNERKDINSLWQELNQAMILLSQASEQKSLIGIEGQIEVQKKIIADIMTWYEQVDKTEYSSKISELAHELNTPLGVCLTVSSVLMNDAKSLEEGFNNGLKRSELEEFILKNLESNRILAFNLQRSKNLIKNYSFLDEKGGRGLKEQLNLRDFLSEICESLQPRLRENDHVVKISCDEQLSITTCFDSLSQIMANLIINSIKHGFQARNHGLIEIACSQHEEQIILDYKDNGLGISKANLAQVFTKNFTTSKSKGGKGIGLHIVKKIIEEELHGSIELSSTPGKGVLFKIRLPAG